MRNCSSRGQFVRYSVWCRVVVIVIVVRCRYFVKATLGKLILIDKKKYMHVFNRKTFELREVNYYCLVVVNWGKIV